RPLQAPNAQPSPPLQARASVSRRASLRRPVDSGADEAGKWPAMLLPPLAGLAGGGWEGGAAPPRPAPPHVVGITKRTLSPSIDTRSPLGGIARQEVWRPSPPSRRRPRPPIRGGTGWGSI